MIVLDRQRRYRLYLISPRYKYKHYATQQELCHLLGKKKMTFPVQLPLIAALTPSHYDITIIDDDTDELMTSPRPDLVGITTLSATIDRCWEIADLYRNMGVPVVMGGSYVSFRTERALKHADHVIIGEAEGVWKEFLADFERGLAKRIYQGAELPEFRKSPLPRWDLINMDEVMTIGVETSRGCPFNCEFCVVNKMFGHKMRFRDVDDVIAEIEASPVRTVFFVADNFAIKKSYAKELVRRLKPLKITWICQTSIQVAKDMDFLKEMADAGCVSVLIGFESLNQATLKDIKKYHNHIEEFERAIERIHSVGIHILASFIVGFDEDTPESFDIIYDFIQRNNLVFAMMNTMSVAPGTSIYERMEKAGRIEVVEPAYRNGIFPCIHYYNISQTQMLDGFFDILEKLFDWDDLSERALRLFSTGYFCKPSTDDISTFDKAKTLMLVLRLFLLTKNSSKRRLFLQLFQLIKEKKLAPDKLILFLLNMEAFNRYLTTTRTFLDDIRSEVAKIDKGPWKDHVPPND